MPIYTGIFIIQRNTVTHLVAFALFGSYGKNAPISLQMLEKYNTLCYYLNIKNNIGGCIFWV